MDALWGGNRFQAKIKECNKEKNGECGCDVSDKTGGIIGLAGPGTQGGIVIAMSEVSGMGGHTK